MVVNGRPLKRAKRRVTADLHDFLTFPSEAAAAEGGNGGLSFRASVRAFLARYARLVPPPAAILSPHGTPAPHLLTWRAAFRVGGAGGGGEGAPVVELDVVEEDVPRSRSVYCDQCRVVGWSGHPVCTKRYHFIIRNDSNLTSRHKICTRCETPLHSSDTRCISCKNEATEDDLEDWAYLQLQDSTHLLHGVVHANGYGHLLRINGREGGSKYLTGRDIMNFWDRLCKMLCVRKVTVMDVSKKHGMEYRILHAVTTGRVWYGEWGYEFGAGSFALTEESYQKAIDMLSSLPLAMFFSHSRSPRTQLQNTISMYRSFSNRQIATVRDLFCFLTQMLHESHELTESKVSGSKSPIYGTSDVLCTWTREDIERAEEAIFKVLQAVGVSHWVSWRALKGATCGSVGCPELLDYCLKRLGGKLAGDGVVVAVRCNAGMSAIQYRLEPASDQLPSGQGPCRPSEDQILRDLKFLYDALLNPATMEPYKPQAARESALSSATKLLDSKQFIRHYDASASKRSSSNPFALHVWSHAELADQPKDIFVPPELLVLPITATVADLKLATMRAFQETYLIFQRFQAEQLLDYGDVSDSAHVKLLLGLNGTCRVKGRCNGDERRLGHYRRERGIENWTVDCTCGAKDDDGERMLACDACGVWQHTRCAGISDFQEVPARFVCKLCMSYRRPHPNLRGNGRYRDGTSGRRCKDEMMPSITEAGEYGRLTTVG